MTIIRNVPKFRVPARAGVRKRTEGMNKLETAYAELLDRDPFLAAWWFEAVKLNLGDRCFYTPDFLVQMSDGSLEIREVKGHWEDDARVKIKVAARMYPFAFWAITRKKGEWVFEEIKP